MLCTNGDPKSFKVNNLGTRTELRQELIIVLEMAWVGNNGETSLINLVISHFPGLDSGEQALRFTLPFHPFPALIKLIQNLMHLRSIAVNEW